VFTDYSDDARTDVIRRCVLFAFCSVNLLIITILVIVGRVSVFVNAFTDGCALSVTVSLCPALRPWNFTETSA